MVKAKSLLVKRVKGIITFKDMQTGNRYYTKVGYISAICMGHMHFTYAGEYTPKIGRPLKTDLKG